MSIEYAVMRVRREIYKRLVVVRLEKVLESRSSGKVTFNDVIEYLLDFYEKHKEEAKL